ncbi:MAG: cbb3-type cytochrome c oxidase subunit 3 [Caulobacterales bacterium]|jgi:cytochrome c oxidase cbb3-type subunit 4
MTYEYETVSRIVQQGGTVYFALLFLVVLAYALWPKKREEFKRAARLPLDEDE